MLQQDGGGGTQAAIANPNSLSQAAINIPAFSEKGPEAELFRSSLKSRWGRNKQGFCLAGRILPQNPTALAGIAKGGVETGVNHPRPKERQLLRCKSTQQRTQNSPTHEGPQTEHNPISVTGESPRWGGGQLVAAPRQGQVLPELSLHSRRVPDPTAPANRKTPFLCPCAGDAGWVQSLQQPAGASCLRRGGAGPVATAAGCWGQQHPKMGC